MAEPSLQGAAEIFDPLRPRLMRVAYRMLGSVSDSEDVVQEAFIRWMGVDRERDDTRHRGWQDHRDLRGA
jgi:RNA polymerase sigma-70 factor (ECF subfamily)